MAKATKKVILFIVEGPTDEDAFSGVMKKLYANQQVVFHVVHGDITTDRSVDVRNAVLTVDGHVRDEMRKYGLRRTDILKIIHLADTDGAYVPDEAILYGETKQVFYTLDTIYAPEGGKIKERNHRKAQVLNKLYVTNEIAGTPYKIYYLSRNLEHVLFNDMSELTTEQKIDYADAFHEKYVDRPSEFVAFMSKSEFTVAGNYHETWRYIASGTNSLHRLSNLHLAFDDDCVEI